MQKQYKRFIECILKPTQICGYATCLTESDFIADYQMIINVDYSMFFSKHFIMQY